MRISPSGKTLRIQDVIRLGLFISLGLILLACGSQQSDSEPRVLRPTQTLIQATATLTSPPPTITPPLPPTPTRVVEGLPTAAAGFPVPDRLAPELDGLLESLTQDMASRMEVPIERVQILSLESTRWQRPLMACDNLPTDSEALWRVWFRGYRAVLGLSDEALALVYHISDKFEFIACEESPLMDGLGQPLPFDSLVEEMIQLAQLDLATRTGQDQAQVQVVDAIVMTWSDSSLGCPLPETIYTEDVSFGYRIWLRLPEQEEEQDYFYHSDELRVIPCPAEQESLPPPFNESAN